MFHVEHLNKNSIVISSYSFLIQPSIVYVKYYYAVLIYYLNSLLEVSNYIRKAENKHRLLGPARSTDLIRY